MRRRILLAIGGTLLVMLIIISLASSAILRDSYADLERRYIERDIQRVAVDVARQEAGIGKTTEDYAAWTELYDFVRHPSADFAASNFSPESAGNLNLEVVVVLNKDGKVVFSRQYETSNSRAGLVDSLLDWIAQHPAQGRIVDKDGKAQGLVGLPQGLLLFAARPILNGMRSLPAAGTLVMGRRFDSEAVSRMGTQLLITLAIYPLQSSAIPDSVRQVQDRLSPKEPLYLDTTLDRMAYGYSMLRDVEGAPVAIVRVDSPRDIRQQGQRTVRFFFIWLFFVGASFCGVVLLTIERTVLSRLVHLGRSVLSIGTGGDPTKRIAIAGTDQIAYISAAINGMLDAQAKATEQLRASERRIETFLDAVPDAIFRVTRDGTIMDARSPSQLPLLEAANDLVGRDTEMIMSLYSFLSPELFDKSIAATAAALDTGVPQMLAFHVDAESGRRWYEERFVAGSEQEVIVLVREVTDLKQAEEARRKEVLLKEIHHRVKNNLQVISSLLALQAGAAKDPHTKSLLHESRNRVHSMALIHEKLYLSADERGVSFSTYVRDLSAHLRHSYAGNSDAVTMEINVEEITLDMDVLVPCGLIINELLSNALKYAFPDGRTGTIHVEMHRETAGNPNVTGYRDRDGGRGMLVLSIRDNGVGLPPGINTAAPSSLGLRIVNTLVSQLHAVLVVGNGPGASFTITFPET